MRPNAATANVARLEAAVAARDADALPALYADEYELVDHTTGVTYDRQGELSSLHFLMKAQEATLRHEPLATLADSLFLGRVSMSGTRFAGKTFDVGVYERELVVVGEADAQGRRRRAEQFATDRLGDAVARLYARYAELLPQGPERACAAATARAVAAMLGPLDLDRFNIALAPAVKFVDRQPFGLPSGGSEAFLSGLRSLLEAFAESATRVDDVLALRSDALLVRWTNFGTQRSGGGAYERPLLALWVFGPDGLATRIEFFPPEHDTEALARFDELTDHTRHARNLLAGIQEGGVDSCLKTAGMTEGAEPAALRRVRPNAATAHAARTEAVIAARDADALGDLLADDYQTLHHTGLVYNREGALVSWRALLRAQDPNYRLEPLATLGDSLALFRMSVSASRIGRGKFDVGAFERDEIVLLEVDARAQSRRAELFTTDRLGDAIVRLYERYAELLPAGPERTRAAAIARSVALSLRPFDLNRLAEAYAPVIELVDHRTLGTWSAHGVAELLRHWRALFDLADDLAVRDDDILALQPDAFLVSRIFCWTDRASGGAGEVAVLALSAFGADGFLTRIEVFDPGRAAEALARFDELTTERMPPASVQRRVWPNAATAAATRLDAAVATRDAKALPDLFSDDLRCVDHMTHTPWDRQAVLASFRSLLLGEDPAYRHEPLATLGDSLALCRVSLGAARLVRGSFDVGPYEKTDIHLVEADGQGRQRWCEIFAADRLGDAVARLYERYAELLPAGLEHTYAAATARSAALMQRYDFDHHDGFARAFAPGIESVDHRILGTWSAHGAEAVLQNIRSWFDLSDDVALRYDDVLALCPDAFLVHATIFGTDRASGGAFERPYLALWVFGADGLVTGWEQFDLGQEDEALARFDELAGRFPLPGGEGAERTAPRFQNAATRTVDRVTETWRIRDWEGNAALFAPGFRCFDRRKLMRVELDRDQYLDSYRPWLEMPTSVPRFEVLATRGRRLAITRATWEGADDLVGLSALEWLMLVEVNDAGQRVAIVNFDPDDLDAAYAELDRRYDAGEGAALGGVTTRYVQSFAKRDWEGVAALCAPTFVEHDHRRITGLGTTRGADVWVKNNVRAWIDLAPDIVTRFTHIRGHGRGVLWQISLQGSREGGPFEIAFAGVMVLDEQCRVERVDLYDLDRIDEAFARFDELVLSAAEGLPAESSQSLPALLSEAAEAERGAEFPPSLARKGARGFGPETATAPTPRIENAATRAADRLNEAIQALDVERYAAQLAPAFRNVDRRRIVSTGLGRDQFLESFAFIFSRLSSATVASEVLATRGDRLALFRMCIGFTESESGPREIEFLQIFEVDALGRIVAGFGFDPHDLDAAYAELDERYAAGEAAPCG